MFAERTCYGCGVPGHLRKDCPHAAKKQPDNVVNYGSSVGSNPMRIPVSPGGWNGGSKPRAQTPAPAEDEGPQPYVEKRSDMVAEWPLESRTLVQLEKATNMKDVETLFSIIPDEEVREQLIAISAAQLINKRMVKEVYLPLGRRMELVTCSLDGGKTEIIESENLMEEAHLSTFADRFKGLVSTQSGPSPLRSAQHLSTAWFPRASLTNRVWFQPDGLRRTGVDGTLHRISRTLNPITKECTTVAARVGRVIQGHVEALLSAPHTEAVLRGAKSVLIIGPPNVGKTTVLREMARLLSEGRNTNSQRHRVVAVVDKSLEIAGSGNVPHSSIGPCRVIQVDNPENQHAAMIEAVENQSPDVVVVDEITNKRQAEAARTIAQRGVQIVATVHGAGLPSIINDPERKDLIGGVTSGVLLSDAAAALRPDKRKAVEKRRGDPPFDIAIEIRGFNDWVIHEDIGKAVDAYLDGSSTAAWRHQKIYTPKPGKAKETAGKKLDKAAAAREAAKETLEQAEARQAAYETQKAEEDAAANAESEVEAAAEPESDLDLIPNKDTAKGDEKDAEKETAAVETAEVAADAPAEGSAMAEVRAAAEGLIATQTAEAAAAAAAAAAQEDDEEVLCTPIVAICSPGDMSFEYCSLAKGETLPLDPDERKDLRCKFYNGRN